MPTVTYFTGQTPAVMTTCNKLVIVEFYKRSDSQIELRLVHAGSLENVRGYKKLIVAVEDYNCLHRRKNAAQWALDRFNLEIAK